MTSIVPLPFTPVAIAIETIKIKKRSDDVQLGGIGCQVTTTRTAIICA